MKILGYSLMLAALACPAAAAAPFSAADALTKAIARAKSDPEYKALKAKHRKEEAALAAVQKKEREDFAKTYDTAKPLPMINPNALAVRGQGIEDARKEMDARQKKAIADLRHQHKAEESAWIEANKTRFL